jgi:hypothetical protein
MKLFKTSEEMHQHSDNFPAQVQEILANPPKDKGAAMVALCPMYQMARPLLASLVNMFFIPQKLKDLISGMISVLDLLCPPVAAEGSPEPVVPLYPEPAKPGPHKETKAEHAAAVKEEKAQAKAEHKADHGHKK